MFDFLFRRGNPTNRWSRARSLTLRAALDVPSLNCVALGMPFERLSFLGRSDDVQFGTLCYFDVGVGIDCTDDGSFSGYCIVLADEDCEFQPYRGELWWKERLLDANRLKRDDLASVLGDWYWMETDEDESIAFYEYPGYEVQIEFALSGMVKRFIVTDTPLLGSAEQREAYRIDKPWPPL